MFAEEPTPSARTVPDLRQAMWALSRLHRQLEAADSGLTLPQYRMLSRLAAGGVQSARLAEALTVRRPTVTVVADGLVAAGLAVRERDSTDRRIVRLVLTEQGRAALAAAEDAFIAQLEPILADLPDSRRFIGDLVAIGEIFDARMRQRKGVLPVAATSPDPATSR